MRELTSFETGQASGGKAPGESSAVVQVKSVSKNNQLVNMIFRVINGLFGTNIPYLK